ncbi:unnamed protein product [marine sediment metagenome]|uniref:Uncharacterized protein n=1 Tax=marine sediment metagenome TaxID=412755 RepID=X1EJC3_9ZZZZ
MTLTEKSCVRKYILDPYSARAFILNLEIQYDLTIRVCESAKHCSIFIDKEEKEDVPSHSQY